MPPLIHGISFGDAIARFRLVGWQELRQHGSHVILRHPNLPGVLLNLPRHPGKDLNSALLGAEVERAGLTREQFFSLGGSGRRRNARTIKREVYGMLA